MPFRAKIVSGSLDFGTGAANSRFQEWKREHEGAHVLIEHIKPERSVSQLRFYRAWLDNMCAHTGNLTEEMHEWLLKKCAPRIVVTIVGPKGKIEDETVKRTHGADKLTMTKDEMSEYLDKCAALTGYPLPTPEELEAMGYLPH